MQVIKKHTITLLEVLICVILAGIILSFLFSLLRKTLEKKQEIAQLKQWVYPREMMRLKIHQIVATLDRNTDESSIWTEQDNPLRIFFRYNHKDRNPSFCGIVCSLLYVNEEQQLCLSTFSKRDGERRKEVLLENVSDFSFDLFNAKKVLWQSEWLETEKQLPEMMQLHLKIDQEYYDLVLFVTDPENPIPYRLKS